MLLFFCASCARWFPKSHLRKFRFGRVTYKLCQRCYPEVVSLVHSNLTDAREAEQALLEVTPEFARKLLTDDD